MSLLGGSGSDARAGSEESLNAALPRHPTTRLLLSGRGKGMRDPAPYWPRSSSSSRRRGPVCGRGLVILQHVEEGLGRQGGLVVEVVERWAGRLQEDVLLLVEEEVLVVIEEEVQPFATWCRCHALFHNCRLRRAVADWLVGGVLILVLVRVLLVWGPGLAAGERFQGPAGGGVRGGRTKAAVTE